jgi:hypothetical protein
MLPGSAARLLERGLSWPPQRQRRKEQSWSVCATPGYDGRTPNIVSAKSAVTVDGRGHDVL